MPAPRDTSRAAWSRQIEALRALEPAQRVRLALEMSEEVNAIARAGIRSRHPGWSEARVQMELDAIVGRALRSREPLGRSSDGSPALSGRR